MSALMQVIAMMGKVVAPPPSYTTWNPSDKTSSVSLSGGNLVASTSGYAGGGVRSVIGKSSGKWYWEVTMTTDYYQLYAGVSSAGGGLDPAHRYATGMGWDTTGVLTKNNAPVGSPGTYTTGDVLGFALDMGAGTLQLFKNNVSKGTFSSLPTGTLHAVCGPGAYGGGSGVFTANFGATALTYSPPSGFNAGLYS